MNCKGFESTISLFALAYVCALTMVGCKPSHDSSELNEQLLSKFDEYPLVALGEDHGWIEESELVSSLINDPLFPQKVNDVVIECGNARFQPLVDDYVNGEPVPDSALQQTWRNMTVLCTCDAPVYAQLFRTVKEVNQKLPSANRIRILLGEPPLDWSKINKAEELGPWIAQRDQHYSDVVEKEVIRKNRKALLIMGSLHFIKAGWGQFPQNDHADPNLNNKDVFTRSADSPLHAIDSISTVSTEPLQFHRPDDESMNLNVATILENKFPNKIFIILPYDGQGDSTAILKMEEKIKDLKMPSLLMTKNTWVGELSAGDLFYRKSILLENGKEIKEVRFNPFPDLKVSDLCDAFLFIAKRDKMTRSVPRDILRDKKYLEELNRRSTILSGKPFRIEDYTDVKEKIF